MKNAIVGQSGGPTAAINATLSGVIRGCFESKEIDKVYGMLNGIEGLFERRVCVLNDIMTSEADLVALEKTPAAALGSCRKKLPAIDTTDADDIEKYKKLFEILDEYNVGYFFYIGGNDSMDTIRKMSHFAKMFGSDIKFVGVPKTIDNDLDCTDHTPGYGSAAKYVATSVSEIIRDTAVYTVKAVTIVEIMGRDAGWLTASAALPTLFGKPAPDLVYLPEVPFSVDDFINDLKALLEKKPNIVVAVSEGVRDKHGAYIGESEQAGKIDAFGHKYLAGTGRVLESYVREYIGCKARTVEMSLLQRCAAHIASKTDIEESVRVGKYAVTLAVSGETGCMAAYERRAGSDYFCDCKKANIESVANVVRSVPRHFINSRGNNVTEDCLKWIAPLVEGESIPEFENGLPVHFSINR